MKKVQSGRTRNDYMHLIQVYSQRREASPKKSKTRQNLTLKINRFRRAIARIHQQGLIYTCINGKYRELPPLVHEAAKEISLFFHETIRASHAGRKNYTIAQRCFCKYAMELGLKSRDVSFFLGSTNPNVALYARLRFTRSFKTNQTNKQIYHSFLQSLK